MIPTMTIPLLVHAVAAGAALLALWLYARLGQRQPQSLKAIGFHLAAAFVLLGLAPSAIGTVGGDSFSRAETVGALFGVLLPALVYVFLTALWLLGVLQRSISLR